MWGWIILRVTHLLVLSCLSLWLPVDEFEIVSNPTNEVQSVSQTYQLFSFSCRASTQLSWIWAFTWKGSCTIVAGLSNCLVLIYPAVALIFISCPNSLRRTQKVLAGSPSQSSWPAYSYREIPSKILFSQPGPRQHPQRRTPGIHELDIADHS